jgi:cytochrome c2
MKKLSFLFIIMIFTACSVKLMTPAQSDIDRVYSKYPGYTLTELNQGKTLFEQTCSRCHKLKNPTSRNEGKWNQIVPKMIGKLNKKQGKTEIDENQQAEILKYLVTMSGRR